MGIDHMEKIRSYCRKCPRGNCDDYEANDDALEQTLVLLRLCLNCDHVPGKHNVKENTAKDAFEVYLLVMRPKKVFLTIYETKEDYDSFLRPSSNATPRVKAFISNESTAVTLYIGDFALNERESLTVGLLNLVLAVHLFRKENLLDFGNAFVARDFNTSQENYYQAMLNTSI
ncbi:unnamed protein product [Allacma fusca]|uniref:Uncharacterized protein n=1 Tax=Allacma fusca TaxID=39272 RepID=A0A8J2JKK7_9HEXA|nr:unnamed protein product [Allacma fusca]